MFRLFFSVHNCLHTFSKDKYNRFLGSYNLGQNKWNIWTTPPPLLLISMMPERAFIIALGGKRVNCSLFSVQDCSYTIQYRGLEPRQRLYIKELLVRWQWLVCSVTPSKIKKRNHSINQVKKLGYERWLIYKQPRQDLDLCGNSFARYSEKCSAQIIYRALYGALYGDAMATTWQHGGRKVTKTVIEFCHRKEMILL